MRQVLVTIAAVALVLLLGWLGYTLVFDGHKQAVVVVEAGVDADASVATGDAEALDAVGLTSTAVSNVGVASSTNPSRSRTAGIESAPEAPI